MKVAILGAGRRGIRLARHLVEEKIDVIIIDDDQRAVEKAMQSVDCIAYNASGTDGDALKAIGIQDVDAFVALTTSDETNLVSCSLVAATFGTKTTIAAVRNLSYTKTDSVMGVTHIINPYQEVAHHIYRAISQGIYSENISFEDSTIVLYNVFVEKGSKYANKLVKNIRHSVSGNFVIAAISRNGEAFVPNGDTQVLQGDTLSLAVQEESVETILDSVGRRRSKPKKIVIVGSTSITDFLLKQFEGKKPGYITVIAKEAEDCRNLAEKYPNALVMNSNITEEGIFEQEELDKYDLLIGATDNDELNIITASFAKNYGVKNCMAIVNKNPDFLHMANHLDIDSLISAQNVTVDSVMRFLHGDNFSSVHSLFDGQLETFEFKISDASPVCNLMLKDINMKGKGIIVGLVRSGETSIPGGNDTLKAGDTIILVSQRNSISFIQKLFALNMEN